MNVLITLPKQLIDKIISGEKKYEMRKWFPKFMRLGEDGFFVVEKGTDKIRCWCRVEYCFKMYGCHCEGWLFSRLCVSKEYIRKYSKGKQVYLWRIGKVKVFESLKRDPLLIKRNPQQFAYCPLSYGESY